MDNGKAALIGGIIGVLAFSCIGGIGIAAGGDAFGVGCFGFLLIGVLLAVGINAIYKAGEQKGISDRPASTERSGVNDLFSDVTRPKTKVRQYPRAGSSSGTHSPGRGRSEHVTPEDVGKADLGTLALTWTPYALTGVIDADDSVDPPHGPAACSILGAISRNDVETPEGDGPLRIDHLKHRDRLKIYAFVLALLSLDPANNVKGERINGNACGILFVYTLSVLFDWPKLQADDDEEEVFHPEITAGAMLVLNEECDLMLPVDELAERLFKIQYREIYLKLKSAQLTLEDARESRKILREYLSVE